jgi:hypothetical protein
MVKIKVQKKDITIIKIQNEDFISLTDMIKTKDSNFFISDWLRNRNTIEYLCVWEKIHNPDFNYGEYAIITSKLGLNNYKLSVKEWRSKTNAIGLIAKIGRYGGTYAHKDIAFEFGMWISAEFKIYLIKEFQRLKDIESQKLGWNTKRDLVKLSYNMHKDTIKEKLIPKELTSIHLNFVYTSEADILNVVLFGYTAKQWSKKNPEKKGNIRDYADVYQLVCLANLESLNAHFITENIRQSIRIEKLNQLAIKQMNILLKDKNIKKLEKK